jgi:hypothetical protein
MSKSWIQLKKNIKINLNIKAKYALGNLIKLFKHQNIFVFLIFHSIFITKTPFPLMLTFLLLKKQFCELSFLYFV